MPSGCQWPWQSRWLRSGSRVRPRDSQQVHALCVRHHLEVMCAVMCAVWVKDEAWVIKHLGPSSPDF